MESSANARENANPGSQSAVVSRPKVVKGTVLSVLAILFMLMDSVLHLLKPAPVVQAFAQLGYPLSLAVPLGVLELICIALYAVPRTSVLGAILLTGYLGGAVATHVRVGNPLFETIFPIIVGAVAWGGIYLRETRLKSVLPLR